MSEPAVLTQSLTKVFEVPVREGGLGAATKSLFRREHRDVLVVAPAITRLVWRLGTKRYAGASA